MVKSAWIALVESNLGKVEVVKGAWAGLVELSMGIAALINPQGRPSCHGQSELGDCGDGLKCLDGFGQSELGDRGAWAGFVELSSGISDMVKSARTA